MNKRTISLLLVLLPSLVAAAGEPEKKQSDKARQEEKQEVITNETLSRKYGKPEPEAQPAKQDAAAPKPAKKAGDQAAPLTDEARKKKIETLRAEEDRLVRRIRSLKNPFLPRVPPTEEEKKAEEGKGADERVRMLETRLAAVRKELKELQDPGRRAP